MGYSCCLKKAIGRYQCLFLVLLLTKAVEHCQDKHQKHLLLVCHMPSQCGMQVLSIINKPVQFYQPQL